MYEEHLTGVVTSFEQKHCLMPRIMSFFKMVAASQLLSAELVYMPLNWVSASGIKTSDQRWPWWPLLPLKRI